MTTFYSTRIERLDAAIAAVAPITGVAITDQAQPRATAAIHYADSATAPQRAAGTAALAAFDFSDAADATYIMQQERVFALATFLSDHSASAKVLRAVALVLLDQVNTIEAQMQTLRDDCRIVAPAIPAVTYAQYTTTDLANAVQTKINAGLAD